MLFVMCENTIPTKPFFEGEGFGASRLKPLLQGYPAA